MPAVFRKPLPPKPTFNKPNPVTTVEKNQVINPDMQKAVLFRVDLADGTYLEAKGDHAADIYAYLMDCERYCATRPGTVMNYIGPMVNRYDKDGNLMRT
jgi:hypothetical protein